MFVAAQVSGLNSALIYTACNPIARMAIAQKQTLPGLCDARSEVTYRTQKIITEIPVFRVLFPKRSPQTSRQFQEQQVLELWNSLVI